MQGLPTFMLFLLHCSLVVLAYAFVCSGVLNLILVSGLMCGSFSETYPGHKDLCPNLVGRFLTCLGPLTLPWFLTILVVWVFALCVCSVWGQLQTETCPGPQDAMSQLTTWILETFEYQTFWSLDFKWFGIRMVGLCAMPYVHIK